jgi:hypothetical protein
MGRAMYGGVYQPASAHADAKAANSYEQPDLLRTVAFD